MNMNSMDSMDIECSSSSKENIGGIGIGSASPTNHQSRGNDHHHDHADEGNSNSSGTSSGMKIVDAAEAPLNSYQKKLKLRRSTRRRTLAPMYNQTESMIDNDNNNDGERERDDDDDGSDDSLAGKRARVGVLGLEQDNNQNDNESAMKVTDVDNVSVHVHAARGHGHGHGHVFNQETNTCTMTPPKQKRPRRSQRRRSLAIQNGTLLLGPCTDTNIDNGIGSSVGVGVSGGPNSALTMQTMSSLSDVSGGGLSTFSDSKPLEIQSVSASVLEERIQVISASNANSTSDNTQHRLDNVQNDGNDDDGDHDHNHDQMPTTTCSQSTSSTLSSLCNGVAALMDGTANLVNSCNSTSVSVPKKKRQKKKKQKQKQKHTPAPTRRSARIHRRKSTMISSATSSKSTRIKTGSSTRTCTNDAKKDVTSLSREVEPARTSSLESNVVSIKSSLHSSEEQGGKPHLNVNCLPQDADGKNSCHADGTSISNKPCPDGNSQSEALLECNERRAMPLILISEHEPSLSPHAARPSCAAKHHVRVDAEIDADNVPNVDQNTSKSIPSIEMNPPPQNTNTSTSTITCTRALSKPKRRRRSSLGLHVGGLISLKDMEAIEHETSRRRSRRRSVSARTLQPMGVSVNVSKSTSNDTTLDGDNGKMMDVDVDVVGGNTGTIPEADNGKMVDMGVFVGASCQVQVQVQNNDESISSENNGGITASTNPSTQVQNNAITMDPEEPPICNGEKGFESAVVEEAMESIPNTAPLEQTHVAIDGEVIQKSVGDDDISVQKEDLVKTAAGDISPCSIMDSDKKSSARSHETKPFDVTAEEIKLTMAEVFNGVDIKKKPCMTARLFSCAILRLKSRGYEFHQIQPLISLLQAYIDAELASLQDLDTQNEVHKKKLHFCSFDLSSTINPIDTIERSNEVIEECIAKLFAVTERVESFSVNSDREHIIDSCQTFIAALIDFNEEADKKSFARCSEAMPFPWPQSRFAKASKQYQKELVTVVHRITNESSNVAESFVRKSLGDFIGRAIRFHLRRYFNPVPLPLHSDGENLPDYSNTRSRVHELVEMKDDDGSRDTATADGSISSVVGIALQRMLQLSQLNSEILERGEDNQREEGYVASFCNRPASVRGLQERGCVIRLSEYDVEGILLDIEECHIFLAGIRARRFLHELLTWPGVSDAIVDAGGWEKIESLAHMFQKCQLSSEMPAEDHFVLLDDVGALLDIISKEAERLKSIEQICENNLRILWKKFRCGTKNKDLLKLNPCIKTFQTELKIGGTRTKFPSIVQATEWE